jgi:succinate-semialdehyde dehydrogenase/glutarate-semialdehyde dehydrogenase
MPAKSPGAELVSRNPANGEEIGRAPLTMPEEVARAVGRARESQREWSKRSFRERGRLVMKARRIVLSELEEIALLVSQETGKPVAEAISMELSTTLDLMQYFARKSARLLRPRRIGVGQYALMGRSSYEIYKPLGVVGIVSPWNFPWATPLAEVVMALLAGNGVVLKPSELTPLTGLKIKDIFDRAGLADGLLQVVTGDGSTGAALVGAGVDKIMFTGSVATGKRVAEAAARYLTPVVLELGGKDPMVVLDDANIQNAARGAVWGAFANSGQSCASVERCYVHESLAEQFIAEVVAETKRLRQAIGTDIAADVGSMTSERQLLTVQKHVDEAIDKGATALTGGDRVPDVAGKFFPPTVLIDVNHEMDIMREETFGPVAPLFRFKTEEEGVAMANDSEFGLAAYFYARDIGRIWRVGEAIESGMVGVNTGLISNEVAPFGGVKQSGIGREGSKYGMEEFLEVKYLCLGGLDK